MRQSDFVSPTDQPVEDDVLEQLREVVGEERVLARRETALHAAADAHVPKLSVAVRYAFAMGRRVARSKNPERIAAVVRKALDDVLPKTLFKAYVAGGEAGVKMLGQLRAAGDVPGHEFHGNQWTTGQGGQGERTRARTLRTAAGPFKMKFDASNPRAAKWARTYGATLAKGIADTTRERISEAIARSQETGEDPYDEILDAVGDEDRAEVIARTESMRAVHEGQREGWEQAVEKGLLTGDERRVWIVTPDDILCPICEELEDEEADMDGEYPGGIDGPPAHPNCRCTEGLTS